MKKLLSVILSITMLLSMATVAFADDTFVLSGAREVEGIIKVGVNADIEISSHSITIASSKS